MSLQYSGTLRDAQLDAIETVIGTTPKLQIRTGAPPADCATADSGTLLVEMDLPSDWLGDASSGTKSKAGTWSDVGVAEGTAGHFRIKDSSGTTTHAQGTVTATGGGGDMTLDNTSIAVDQAVEITSASFTAGNA